MLPEHRLFFCLALLKLPSNWEDHGWINITDSNKIHWFPRALGVGGERGSSWCNCMVCWLWGSVGHGVRFVGTVSVGTGSVGTVSVGTGSMGTGSVGTTYYVLGVKIVKLSKLSLGSTCENLSRRKLYHCHRLTADVTHIRLSTGTECGRCVQPTPTCLPTSTCFPTPTCLPTPTCSPTTTCSPGIWLHKSCDTWNWDRMGK